MIEFDKQRGVRRRVGTPLSYSDNFDPSRAALGRGTGRHLRGEEIKGAGRGEKLAGSIKQTETVFTAGDETR